MLLEPKIEVKHLFVYFSHLNRIPVKIIYHWVEINWNMRIICFIQSLQKWHLLDDIMFLQSIVCNMKQEFDYHSFEIIILDKFDKPNFSSSLFWTQFAWKSSYAYDFILRVEVFWPLGSHPAYSPLVHAIGAVVMGSCGSLA